MQVAQNYTKDFPTDLNSIIFLVNICFFKVQAII